jgi:hypothetical protein
LILLINETNALKTILESNYSNKSQRFRYKSLVFSKLCKLLSYKGGRDYYTKKYDNQLSGKTFDFVITDEYENFLINLILMQII